MALTFAQRQALIEQENARVAEKERIEAEIKRNKVVGETSTADQDRIMAEYDQDGPPQSTVTDAKIAAQADADAAMAAELNLPSRAINLPTAEGIVETKSQRLANEIKKSNSIDPLVQEMMKTEGVSPEGVRQPVTQQQAKKDIKEAIELGKRRVMPSLNYAYTSGDELRKSIPNAVASNSEYEKVMSVTNRLTPALENSFSNVLTAIESDTNSKELREAMAGMDLISPDGQLSPRLSGIAAFQFLQGVEAELVTRDKMIQQNLNPNEAHNYSDDNMDEFDMLAADIGGDPVSMPHVGQLLNPNYERQSIAKGIVDKALPTPGVVKGIRTGFGGASQDYSNKVLQGMDALLWQAYDEAGFIEAVITDNGDTLYYQYSQEAVDYYTDARQVLNDVIPESNSLPSTIPAFDGLSFTADRDLGFKSQGNVSVKSIRSEAESVEMEAMSNMGRSPQKIIPEMFSIGQRIVNDIIRYRVLPNGGISLNTRNNMALKDKDEKHMFSTNEYADRVGLDKATWEGHFKDAKAKKGMSIIDAQEQANVIMGMKARQLAADTHYGVEFSNRVFYIKKLYASITGRYHDRNTRLSPQQSKYVRNIVGPAVPILIDLAKVGKHSPILDNWKWLIGRILLNKTDTNGLRAEDMGMKEIISLTEQKILNDPENFARLVKMGVQVRELANNPSLDINKSLEAISPDLAEQTNDREEWGFILSAYIDIANYNDHKRIADIGSDTGTVTITTRRMPTEIVAGETTKKETPRARQLRQLIEDAQVSEDQDLVTQLQGEYATEMNTVTIPKYPAVTQSSIFRPIVRGKFDTKQSGPAILAGLFGNVSILKRVGAIYPADSKSVIPEGDIRDLFMDNLLGTSNNQKSVIEKAFVDHPEKQLFWKSTFDKITQENSAKDLARALSRAPLMESSYGKPLIFMQETAMKFINGKFGDLIRDDINRSANLLPGYNENDAIKDLNLLIATTLSDTLDFSNQQVVKDLGLVWSLLGNQNARFISPTGKMVYIGSKTSVDTDKKISLPSPRGQVERAVTRIVPTSTARTASTPLIFEKDSFEMVRGEPTAHGQEVLNQLLVVATQHVDSAIQGITINIANKGRQEKGLAPLYANDIHDSLIVDVMSASIMHSTYNRVAQEMTLPGSKKQYDIFKSISGPLSAGIDDWSKSINKEEIYEVSDKSLEYRALHGRLNLFNDIIEENKDLSIFEGLEGLSANKNHGTKKELAEILKEIKQMGWKPEGAYLSGEQLKKAVISVINYLNITRNLKRAKIDKDANNAAAAKIISPNYLGFN